MYVAMKKIFPLVIYNRRFFMPQNNDATFFNWLYLITFLNLSYLIAVSRWLYVITISQMNFVKKKNFVYKKLLFLFVSLFLFPFVNLVIYYNKMGLLYYRRPSFYISYLPLCTRWHQCKQQCQLRVHTVLLTNGHWPKFQNLSSSNYPA